jgi:hypothetical protein
VVRDILGQILRDLLVGGRTLKQKEHKSGHPDRWAESRLSAMSGTHPWRFLLVLDRLVI